VKTAQVILAPRVKMLSAGLAGSATYELKIPDFESEECQKMPKKEIIIDTPPQE
jgi:hypothetical protein